MKPSRVNKARLQMAGVGSLAAILLAIAMLGQPIAAKAADAADRGTRLQPVRADTAGLPTVSQGVVVVERRSRPEVAPGGTFVLRGSRPPLPNVGQTAPNVSGEGFGSSTNAPGVVILPGAVLSPSAGWDRELDTGGLDLGGVPPPTSLVR